MAVTGFSLFFTLIFVGLLGYVVSLWLFVSLAVLLLLAVIILRRRLPTIFVAIVCSAMIACAFFCLYTQLVYNRAISYSGATLNLTFEITDIEGESDGTYHYRAKITGSEYDGLNGTKVRLSSPSSLEVQVSDFVSTNVALSQAGSGGKSSVLYYKSNGIFLSAKISEDYTVKENPNKSLGFYLFAVKNGVSEIVSANLNEETAAVVNSIFLGDTSELGYKDSMKYRNIGISHIFCVSGLHVTLVSMAIYKFLSTIAQRKSVLYGVTLAVLWFFVAITGFSPSSIRSAIMLSIYYIGCLLGRDSNSLNSLGVAAAVVCLLNPFSATNISFLYSFFATFGMLVMQQPKLSRIKNRFLNSIMVTAIMSLNVMIFTLPIQIFYFGTATIVSPLANCLIFFAIPPLMSCTIIAIILSLFTSVLSTAFFLVCAVIAKYLILISDWVIKLPYTTLDASMDFVKILVVLIAALLLAVWYLKLGRRAVITAASVCGVLLLSGVVCYNVLMRSVMTVTVIDSGGATSVVITQGTSAIVVGCGGNDYTATKVGYELNNGGGMNDTLMLLPSHENRDIVNLDGLVEKTDIDRFILGEEYGLMDTLGIENFRVSTKGETEVGEMTVSYSYTDGHKLTHIKAREYSVLVITMYDGCELCKEWQNSNLVIMVEEYQPMLNGQISVLCTDKNGEYPVTTVCYKGGGNIVMEFFKNDMLTVERMV